MTGFSNRVLYRRLLQEARPNRIPPDDLNQLLQPLFDPEAKRKAIAEGRLLGKGINAGPGAAVGRSGSVNQASVHVPVANKKVLGTGGAFTLHSLDADATSRAASSARRARMTFST